MLSPFVLHVRFLLKRSGCRRVLPCLLLLPLVLFTGNSVEMLTSGLEKLFSFVKF